MAIRTVRIDDISPDEEAAGTAHFSLYDNFYRIDLSDENRKKLEEVLQPFIDAAARTDCPKGGRRMPVGGFVTYDDGAPRSAPAGNPDEPSPAEVRSWAITQGIPVPERGRIPSDITDKYKAAKAEEAKAAEEAAADDEKPADKKK